MMPTLVAGFATRGPVSRRGTSNLLGQCRLLQQPPPFSWLFARSALLLSSWNKQICISTVRHEPPGVTCG